MIDTIRFSINDIRQRYGSVLKYLETHSKGKKGKEMMPNEVDYKFKARMVRYDDTGNTFFQYSKKIFIDSSTRYVNWTYRTKEDKLFFEFSIPKVNYGTNVFQFVNHRNQYSDGTFSMLHHSNIEYQIEHLNKRLKSFIMNFLMYHTGRQVVTNKKDLDMRRKGLGGGYILFEDIELHRIDFCFNRVFNNESDAIMYLELLKGLKRKNSKKVSSNSYNYETAIYDVGRYFTFKIYHKGSEFRKTDLKELMNINERMKYKVYDIKKIMALADRTLRYEIEYKKSALNYVYKAKAYKLKSTEWKGYYKKFVIYQRLTSRLDKVYEWKKLTKSKQWSYKRRLGMSFDERIAQLIKERKVYEGGYTFVKKAIGQVSSFYFDGSDYDRKAMNYILLDERENYKKKSYNFNRSVVLNERIFQELGRHFIGYVKDFTLKKTPDEVIGKSGISLITYINKRNEEMNRIGGKIIKLNPCARLIISYMDRFTLDEIKNLNIVAKSTFYEVKKKIEAIGIYRNTQLNFNIPTKLSFEDYYLAVHTPMMEMNLKSRYIR